MSDFHYTHNDPIAFLNCEDAFQITHNCVFSIQNMSDRELREAIINDLLCVTMWEKECGKTLHFGFTKLYRFIPKSMHKRVRRQMKHDEICGLIDIKRTDNSSEIRIRDDRAIMQAAMDYAGVWFNGYDIPKTGGIYSINWERVEELGGIDAVVDLAIANITAAEMDEKANSPTTTTVN